MKKNNVSKNVKKSFIVSSTTLANETYFSKYRDVESSETKGQNQNKIPVKFKFSEAYNKRRRGYLGSCTDDK